MKKKWLGIALACVLACAVIPRISTPAFMAEDVMPEDPQTYRAEHATDIDANTPKAPDSIVRASITVYSSFTSKSYSVASDAAIHGIDVSYHNGSINWTQVKAAGVKYAFIRLGYRAYGTGGLYQDVQFNNYMKYALSAGVQVGVYFYSQATTTAEARSEANYVLNRIGDYNISMPVMFDFEYAQSSTGAFTGRLYNAHLSRTAATNVCNAFCDTVEAAGYDSGVYMSKFMWGDAVSTTGLTDSASLWLARYNSYLGTDTDYWQYTDTGSVYGISGRYTDCNFLLGALPKQSDTLSITDAKIPGSLSSGGAYSVGGIVRSTGTGLTNVTAGIYTLDGSAVSTKSVTPGVRAYSLSDLASSLKFSALKDGTYVYRITAKNHSTSKTLVQRTFSAGNTQVLPDGTYYLISAIDDGYAVGSADGSKSENANTELQRHTKAASQRCNLTYENGYYSIKMDHCGKSLYVKGNGTAAGTNVKQYTYDSSSSGQRWQLVNLNNGTYAITSRCDGMALTVHGGKASAGANIEMDTYTGADAQRWSLIQYRPDAPSQDIVPNEPVEDEPVEDEPVEDEPVGDDSLPDDSISDAPGTLVPGMELTIQPTQLKLSCGESAQIVPSQTEQELNWNCNNELVATVSDTGMVSAISPGTADIFVSDGTSSQTCALVVEAAKPNPVKITSALAISSKKATITWEAQPTEGYEIYRATTGGAFQKIAELNEGVTTYTDDGLSAGMTYQYDVRAFSSPNLSDASNIATVKTLAVPKVSAAQNAAAVTLRWGAVADADSYQIYQRNASGSYKKIQTVSGLSYTTSNLPAGVEASYKVYAASSTYGKGSPYVKTFTPLAAPSFTTAEGITTTKVKLAWKAVSGATGYRIYRALGSGTASLIQTISNPSTLTWTDTGRSGGKTYTYTICATNSVLTGPVSASRKVRMLSAPQITALTSTSKGKVSISWKSISGAVGYSVYRATSESGTYSLVQTVSSSKKSYTFSNLTSKKTYYYRVYALGSTARSSGSTVKKIKVK